MLDLKSKLDSAKTAYTFDDFTLAPVHSAVKSRKDPDISVAKSVAQLQIPIYSSPMNTVTGAAMSKTILAMGGGAVLHRYMNPENQVAMAVDIIAKNNSNNFFVAVGAMNDLDQRLELLWAAGVRNYCVDVANGHSDHCLAAVKRIKGSDSQAVVMAGNVCTYDGALKLADAGADLIRVGVGNGALCITRIVTGHGVPQLSAIEECARIRNAFPDVVLVADGGLRNSGDMVKALAAGADALMLGSLLSGTSDTPGEIHTDPDSATRYKYYFGMASVEGRDSWFERSKTAYVPEGEATRVPYKGPTVEILEQLVGGVRVGMSYAGAHDLEELRDRAVWVKVSPAGLIEGTPHGKR